ncbi:MAG: M1 family metallopeptidase [Nannocystis sp.]|nr:M1 family metallopeptidase [Nannocystis sp.]
MSNTPTPTFSTPPAAVPTLPALQAPGPDPHSFARPDEARVTHLGLDLVVDFDAHILSGAVTLAITRRPDARELVLDTRDLEVDRVEVATATATDPPLRLAGASDLAWRSTTFGLGGLHPVLGRPLHIDLPPAVDRVRVTYRTTPAASGLQWLGPEQTADHLAPFLYTQSQAIHARSWVPVQDSPGIRITFDARVRSPAPTVPVMAAETLSVETGPEGQVHRFALDHSIPPYLLALAVGRLESASTGPRTGVWAEPSLVARARHEFADLEAMLATTEQQFGPYRWGRYEVLVLPPAFPFGGMENPRVTFVTPTILAGDRSLVALIAHELAHSWSGNLVSNATWRDLWLNEGFTVYLERRIVEAIYGAERAEIEAALGRQDLERDLAALAEHPGDTVLHVDLAGRDPDDVFSDIPYEKGYLLLRRLEQAFGRPAFDLALARWFAEHAFTSQPTAEFTRFFREVLLTQPLLPGQNTPDLELWLTSPGLLPDAPQARAPGLDAVATAAASFARGETPAKKLPTRTWSPQHWIYFLRSLPLTASNAVALLDQLDAAFQLGASSNYEVLAQWLLLAATHDYRPADARLERFLVEVGRRKYLTPIYEALLASPTGQPRAHEIYAKARPAYHPITQRSLDALLAPPTLAGPEPIHLPDR